MKNNRFPQIVALSVGLVLAAFSSVKATPLYWDVNGVDTAGGATASTTTATGTWNSTNAFWNPDPTGGNANGAAVITTTINDDLFFSAGSDVTGNSTVTVSGSQSGKSIAIVTGTVTLAGSSTPVLVLGSGGITVNIGNAFLVGSSVTSTQLAASQTWTNLNPTGAAFTMNSSANAISGVPNTGNITLTLSSLDTTSDGTRLQGLISNGTGNVLSILKTGSGIWRFDSTTSTYSGGFTLNAGTLDLGASSTPTSGAVTSGPIGTGTLTLQGGNLNSRTAGRTLANAVLVQGDFGMSGGNATTLSGPIDLGGGTRTVSVLGSANQTLSGTITNGGLAKAGAGAGALVVSGSLNAYAGGTTVTTGTLSATTGNLGTGNVTLADTAGVGLTLGNATAIGDSATLTFGNNSQINLNAGIGTSETIFALFDSTTSTFHAPGTYDVATLNTDFGGIATFTSANGETLTIAVPEPGTWAMLLGGAGALMAFQRSRSSRRP